MTAVTSGTNATIRENSAEAHLFSAITLLKIVESDIAFNPDKQQLIKVRFDDNALMMNAEVNLKASLQITNTGRISLDVTNPFPNYGNFTPGNPVGDFKSVHLAAYLIEVLSFLIEKEKDATANFDSKNYVSSSYDSATETISATVQLPYTRNWYSGGLVIYPAAYMN